jgi:hypothetical protein
MASKKTADTGVFATPTEDGHAVVGGRTNTTMYESRNSWGKPRPDGGPAKTAVPDPGAQLPGVHVARQIVGREVQRLQAEIDGTERFLARGILGVQGRVVPHLVEQHNEAREGLERLRAEVDRLNGLSGTEAQQFAYDKGYR